jgi:hypothetical protein
VSSLHSARIISSFSSPCPFQLSLHQYKQLQSDYSRLNPCWSERMHYFSKPVITRYLLLKTPNCCPHWNRYATFVEICSLQSLNLQERNMSAVLLCPWHLRREALHLISLNQANSYSSEFLPLIFCFLVLCRAGITLFFTSAYILFLNPLILSGGGLPKVCLI